MVRETIEGILGQTFHDWELLAIDDGSTDSTRDVLSSFADPRIRVISNQTNLGLIRTLNRGLELATGEFVARMDSDDVPLPQWLEKTVGYLDQNLRTVLVSCWAEHYEDASLVDRRPVSEADVRANLFIMNCIKHPGVLMRRSVLVSNSLAYRIDYLHAEDYKLWIELLEYGELANLPVPLVRIRFHSDRITVVHGKAMRETLWKVQCEQLDRLLGRSTDQDRDLHYGFLYKATELPMAEILCWRRRLVAENRLNPLFDQPSFEKALDDQVLEIHDKRMHRSLATVLHEKLVRKTRRLWGKCSRAIR